MAREHLKSAPSTAAIDGHPLHPAVVPFPIAFLVTVPVADLLFQLNGKVFWAEASYWLLLGGLLTGTLAAVLGATDFFTIPRARMPIGFYHMVGNIAVLILSLVNFLLRLDNPQTVPAVGIGISVVVMLILLVTGWLGGELAYRYKIGVNGYGSRTKK